MSFIKERLNFTWPGEILSVAQEEFFFMRLIYREDYILTIYATLSLTGLYNYKRLPVFSKNRNMIQFRRVLSFWIQHRVVQRKSTVVSREYITFIFRFENETKQETSMKQAASWFITCLRS
jgi:hypothetical protein